MHSLENLGAMWYTAVQQKTMELVKKSLRSRWRDAVMRGDSRQTQTALGQCRHGGQAVVA